MLNSNMQALPAEVDIAKKDEYDLQLLSEEERIPNPVMDVKGCYQSVATISQARARSVESQKNVYQDNLISELEKEGMREDREQATNNNEVIGKSRTMVPHYPKEPREQKILFKRLMMTKHKLLKKIQKRKEQLQTRIQSSKEIQKKLSITVKNIEDEIETKKGEVEKLKSSLEYYQTSHKEMEDGVKTLTEGFHDKRLMVLSFLCCAKNNLGEVFEYLENQVENIEEQLAQKWRLFGKKRLRREKTSIESFTEEIGKLMNDIENHFLFFKSHELSQK